MENVSPGKALPAQTGQGRPLPHSDAAHPLTLPRTTSAVGPPHRTVDSWCCKATFLSSCWGRKRFEPKDRTVYLDLMMFQLTDFCLRPASDNPQSRRAHPPHYCLDDSFPNFGSGFQVTNHSLTSTPDAIILLLAFCLHFCLFYKVPGSPARTSRSARLATLPEKGMAERCPVLGTHARSPRPLPPLLAWRIPSLSLLYPSFSELLTRSKLFLRQATLWLIINREWKNQGIMSP